MRVIAGEAKGRPLKAPRGLATRPTADKIKGAMFSMLESWIMAGLGEGEDVWSGRRVIDLYAGTGALGIEALSRGATWADFVEGSAAACRAIEENLARTGLQSRGKVHCVPVRRALSEGYRRQLTAPYDLVFMDPPYGDPMIGEVIEEVSQPAFVKPNGLVVVEHSRRVSLPVAYGDVVLIKSRRHGDTCISIYARGAQPCACEKSQPKK